MINALLIKERIDINDAKLYEKIEQIPFISKTLTISQKELAAYKEDCLIVSSPIPECYDLAEIAEIPKSSTCYVDFELNDGIRPFIQCTGERVRSLSSLTMEHTDGLTPIGINFVLSADIKNFSKELSPKGHLLQILPKRDLSLDRTPALFLDRDGVINFDVSYLHKIEDLEIFEEIAPIIRTFNERGWPVIVITNQSGVARGRFTLQEVKDLNSEIDQRLTVLGARVDHWEISPYHFEKGLGEYKKHSLTRKPGPGMALVASEKFNIDFARSVMIGDKKSDILDHLNIFTLNIRRDYDLCGTTAPVCENYDELDEKIREFLNIK